MQGSNHKATANCKQTAITHFFSVQKERPKIACGDVITTAENKRLSKIYRQNARMYRQKKAAIDCADDLECSQPADIENAISPQIVLETPYGYAKYTADETDYEMINHELSPSKRSKPDVAFSGLLTVTRSMPQAKKPLINVSRTLRMTQLVKSDPDTGRNELFPSAQDVMLSENINIGDLLEVQVLEDNQLQKITNHVSMIEDIIENTTKTHLSPLLFSNERNVLQAFQELSIYEKYIACKLFTHQLKWHNVHKFLDNISITQIGTTQIINNMSEKLIVKSDYSSESTVSLLNLLQLNDVKSLHDTLRLKTKQKKKELLISAILKYITNQTTLHPSVSLDMKVRKMIFGKLGDLIHIHPLFYTALYKVHVLYTYGNFELDIPGGLYLRIINIKVGNVLLPEYTCTDELIFENAQEFSEFYKAFSYKTEVIQILEKKGASKFSSVFDLSREIVEEFRNVLTKVNGKSIKLGTKPNHLKRFTPGHQYAGALWIMCQHLSSKYPSHVREWLEILLGQKHFYQKKRGLWYSQLSMVYKAHLKQNDKSIEALAFGLQDEDVSDVDMGEIVYRARNYCTKKNLNTENLSKLLIASADSVPHPDVFPNITIKALGNFSSQTIAGTDYRYMNANGDQVYMNVEQIAIRHYIDEKGFVEGMHCEGALMITILYVLFWDIIYTPGIDYTFVCKMQHLPLDFYSEEFYRNRKAQIDRRLEEVKFDWTSEYLKSYITERWYSVSKHKSFFLLDQVNSGEKLYRIVSCIGRAVVSDICRRLVTNLRDYRAGMPDLFVYNETSCKFVEVKGPGDTLSTKQKLWINYLISVGANAEVCYVSKIGGKKNK